MKKSLAFFGAFNPLTVAHLSLAQFARAQTGCEKVIFVPSKSVYIRDGQKKDFAWGDEQRLCMLRKAAEGRPWMAVCDWEMRQETQPRTYVTLCRLRKDGVEAALLLGSDKLPELEHGWLYVEEIAREFGIVCLARGSDDCERILRESPFLNRLSPRIRILETPEETRGVSSTAVRDKIRKIQKLQKELARLVPPEILPILLQGGNSHEA